MEGPARSSLLAQEAACDIPSSSPELWPRRPQAVTDAANGVSRNGPEDMSEQE